MFHARLGSLSSDLSIKQIKSKRGLTSAQWRAQVKPILTGMSWALLYDELDRQYVGLVEAQHYGPQPRQVGPLSPDVFFTIVGTTPGFSRRGRTGLEGG